jgi:predicted O-methyltransferase YrrM
VDLVFLDADKEGYADYLKQLLLLLRCGGTVIAHNIEPGRADAGLVRLEQQLVRLDELVPACRLSNRTARVCPRHPRFPRR